MSRRLRARSFTPWLIVLLIWIVARLACVAYVHRDADEPQERETRVIVSERSETLMQPLSVKPPQQERWRDIADVAYADDFSERFAYADTDRHRVEIRYDREAGTLRGLVEARGLKPSFAYQLKLVGLEPIVGASEAENAVDLHRWSSWQLGRLGRWWCDDCQWNVLDADLAEHVRDGHAVSGYVLFDWFVTDGNGDAEHAFALDSTLHVLWRVGQRDRGPNDTAPRYYTVKRLPSFYPPSAANTRQQVGLFGEWEPDRPRIGQARLAPGSYEVGMNITEETFHANLGEDRALDGGGFWAWVLQSELRFDVRQDPASAGGA